MVTNLPSEARAQWRKVVEAKDPETKLRELEKFYSLIPKHKGCKNLIKQVRRQMARLREEIEERRRKGGATYLSKWNEYKHGIGRIALLYEDFNAGINAFRILSGRELDVASIWSFEPEYGVLTYNSLQFQLSLLPPLGISESVNYRILNYIKSTVDYILIVDSSTSNLKNLLERLYSEGLYIGSSIGKISISKTPVGGIRIIGGGNINYKEVEELLRSYKIHNAIVRIEGDVSISDIEDHILGIRIVKPGSAILLCNNDVVVYWVERNKLIEPALKYNTRELVDHILSSMNLIRVYTKPYKDEVFEKPVILPSGSTVLDLAEKIHSKLARNFRYAIIIRDGKRIRASAEYILRDGDIVTIHT